MMRLVALALVLSGCVPALLTFDDNPRRSVPVYYSSAAPEPPPPTDTREAALQRIRDAQAAKVAKAEARAEAAKRAEEQARVDAIAGARKDRLCKSSDDDRACLKAHFLREDILSACFSQ